MTRKASAKYSPVNDKYKTRTREGVTPAGRPYKATIVRNNDKGSKKIYKGTQLEVGKTKVHTKSTGLGAPYAKKGESRIQYNLYAGGARRTGEPGSKVPLGKKK